MIGRKQPPIAAEETVEPKGFDDYDVSLGDVMRGERATLGKSLLDVQRELKIKATYVAAIENADPTAFETPGFVAGYVRSYARYLGLDPEWAYAEFCREGNFATVHGMDKGASSPKPTRARKAPDPARDPLSDPKALFVPRSEALFSGIEPGAIGSSLVLLALIGALGFGGWSVLREIQKVQLAPVEQSPGVIAEIDPLEGANAVLTAENSGVDAARSDALDRLYRPEPLDVPDMVPRDGPIATIRPGALGALGDAPVPQSPRVATAAAQPAATEIAEAGRQLPDVPSGQGAANGAQAEDDEVRVVADNAPDVVLFATRPSWVRVTSAEGTVLLEKILDAGERYVLPATEAPPKLRTGYAGAIYFAVNGTAYGPAGEGASVVSDIALGQEQLKDNFQLADLSEDPELATLVAEVTVPIKTD